MRTTLGAALLALTAIPLASADDIPTLEELADLQIERLGAIEDIQFEGTAFVPMHDPAQTDPGAWRPFRMVFAGERYVVSREVMTFWGPDHEVAVFDGRDGWHTDPVHRIVHLEGSQREVFARYNPLTLPQVWLLGVVPRIDLPTLLSAEPDWSHWTNVASAEVPYGDEVLLRYTFDLAGSAPSQPGMTVTFSSGEEWFPIGMGPTTATEASMMQSGTSTMVSSVMWFDAGDQQIPLATTVLQHAGFLFGTLGVRISPETVRINEGVDDSLFAIEPPHGGYLVYDVFEGVFVSDPVEEEAHRDMMRLGQTPPAPSPSPRGPNWRALISRYWLALVLVAAVGLLAILFRPREDDL